MRICRQAVLFSATGKVIITLKTFYNTVNDIENGKCTLNFYSPIQFFFIAAVLSVVKVKLISTKRRVFSFVVYINRYFISKHCRKRNKGV